MMDNKLEQLQYKIRQLKSQNHPIVLTNSKHEKGALTICIELVAGIIVGLLVGIFLGNLLGAKLLWIIICLTLSIITTFRTLWQKLYNREK